MAAGRFPFRFRNDLNTGIRQVGRIVQDHITLIFFRKQSFEHPDKVFLHLVKSIQETSDWP